ncbi:MAG: orotidine-5'-phosphate decarboxylase [Bacillota bacterium]|nr:orotidine-5'-phosphate decarboxylase [Bacillota bacterium]HHU29660.1 orotidine-5'-phosphate decarboxylase [Bacillota bacterium]
MRERIIVALDVENEHEALALADQLRDYAGAFKVGLQLYGRAGPPIVRSLTEDGHKVFLDLKFHDIPNTVGQAAEAAVDTGAFMINFHAAGGRRMLEAAVTAAGNRAKLLNRPAPLLIGVTVLTSLSGEELLETGLSRTVEEQVAALACLCQEAGLDGVVASAREIPVIRKACGRNFLVVTPGIRPVWAADNDQRRVVTPKEALKLGADYLVVGRPITAAPSPREAAARLLAELAGEI